MPPCRAVAIEPAPQRLDLRFDEVLQRLRAVVDRVRLLLRGTLPPALRASDNPIAIACLRLVTRRPERPLRSVPFLRSRIARATFVFALDP
jgi:hypothetical protein